MPPAVSLSGVDSDARRESWPSVHQSPEEPAVVPLGSGAEVGTAVHYDHQSAEMRLSRLEKMLDSGRLEIAHPNGEQRGQCYYFIIYRRGFSGPKRLLR